VRDLLTYIIAVLVFIILGFFSTPYWLVGTILLLIYFLFVFLVYTEEKGKKATIGKSNPVSGQTSTLPYDEYSISIG